MQSIKLSKGVQQEFLPSEAEFPWTLNNAPPAEGKDNLTTNTNTKAKTKVSYKSFLPVNESVLSCPEHWTMRHQPKARITRQPIFVRQPVTKPICDQYRLAQHTVSNVNASRWQEYLWQKPNLGHFMFIPVDRTKHQKSQMANKYLICLLLCTYKEMARMDNKEGACCL